MSEAALVGGGEIPRPGEISLAHNGVLFLDELAEFRRSSIEALRQPLEDGRVCISRARARAWFPAQPMLVGAVNPCHCGYLRHPTRECRCTERARRAYHAKLSGPLIDRLDVHTLVPPVSVDALIRKRSAETSATVRERVRTARRVQLARRATGATAHGLNAHLSARELSVVAKLDSEGRKLVESALSTLGLSARAYTKILRVARTVADLDGSAGIRVPHLKQAILGRMLDREPIA